MRSHRGPFLAALLLVLGVAASAQGPSQSPFKADTSAVMVDVVVRDKKGNPVTDLTVADFELLEDGVPQVVQGFAMAEPGGATTAQPVPESADTTSGGPHSVPAPGTGDRDFGNSLVAIVFERLAPESRAPATVAARAYLARSRPGDAFGVFVIDLALRTVQPYTNDRAALVRAIDAVSSEATSYYEPNRVSVGPINGMSAPATLGAESRGAGWLWGPDQTKVLKDLSEITNDRFREITQLQQGHATINALEALVSTLGLLPGRKTIVYLSDGLPLAGDGVSFRLDALIHLANRLNVTVYPMDAVGLRVHSQDAINGRAIQNGSLSDLDSGGGMGLAMAQSVFRTGTTSQVFDALARGTGGFVVENTNDLVRGFRDIDLDRRFHYVLTYVPRNPAFHGEWRAISVKVPSRTVQVRARAGYLAVRGMSGIPLLAYEAPAIAALDARPLPRQLPLKATALGLLSRSGEPRVAVVVSADATALTFKPNAANDAFVTDFTILARIKDAEGTVVRKASEPYRLSGPIADMNRARTGEILFFRQPELPAGRYMLETAVHDALASRAGAQFVPFTVYEPSPHGMLVSGLVLVQRSERVDDAKPEDTNLLVTGDLLLYPRLGDPYKKSADKAVSFFVRLKVPQGAAPPSATLVLLRNGQAAATLPLPLPSPDAQGVIDHTAQLPLEALPIGDFVLRLVVTVAGDEVVREVPFRVIE